MAKCRAIPREILNYIDRGWRLIPMASAGKRPAVRWRRYQNTTPSTNSIRRWFAVSRYGVGVIFGDASGGLLSRDFDSMTAYDAWSAAHPTLARTLPTAITKRGRHVYAVAAPGSVAALRATLGKASGTGAIACGDGELRAGTGCYSILPPTRRLDGFRYAWERQLPKCLPVIDPVEAGLIPAALLAAQAPCNREHREDRRPQRITEAIVESVIACDSVDFSSDEIAQAIARSLPTGPGQRNRQIFKLCRELKGIAAIAGANPQQMVPAFNRWYLLSSAAMSGEHSFDDCRYEFLRGWQKVAWPAGTEPMAQIIEAAMKAEPPACAARYEDPRRRKLVSICRELQRHANAGPFFISCRKAAEAVQVDHTTASRYLGLMVLDGILEVVIKGQVGGGRASRYRYLPPLD